MVNPLTEPGEGALSTGKQNRIGIWLSHPSLLVVLEPGT